MEELEESNYDQIDGTLNNLEPKEPNKEGEQDLSIMEKLEQSRKRISREASGEKDPKDVEKQTEKKSEREMD